MFVFTLLTKNGTKNITSDLDKRVKGTVRCNIFGTKRKNRWGMCLFQITYKDLKPTVLGNMFISNLLLFIGQSLFSWRTHCFRCQPSSVFPPLRLSHQECGLFWTVGLDVSHGRSWCPKLRWRSTGGHCSSARFRLASPEKAFPWMLHTWCNMNS